MLLGVLHIPNRISQQNFMHNLGVEGANKGMLESREFDCNRWSSQLRPLFNLLSLLRPAYLVLFNPFHWSLNNAYLSGPKNAYTASAQQMLEVCNKALNEVGRLVSVLSFTLVKEVHSREINFFFLATYKIAFNLRKAENNS